MSSMWHESFIFLNTLIFIQKQIIVYPINKGLPLWQACFVLRERAICQHVKGGILKFRNMRIYAKGGCHYG